MPEEQIDWDALKKQRQEEAASGPRWDKRLFLPYRSEKYYAVLWDQRTMAPIRRLDNILGGSITASVDARIKTSGKLQVRAKTPVKDWARLLIQIRVVVNGFDFPLGMFMPSAPVVTYKESGAEYDLELNDLLLVLDQDKLDQPLGISPGMNLVYWVMWATRQAGIDNVSIAWAEKVNKRPLTWDAGTEKLTVFNDIMDYVGYFSLTCTPEGAIVSEPYVLPKDRNVVYSFLENSKALFSADVTIQHDLANIPNKIVYSTQSTGDNQTAGEQQKPMIAVATNEDDSSPYSHNNRGRWIVEVKTDVEAESQEILDKKVQKRLENAKNPMVKVEIENALLPLRLNNICRFAAYGHDIYASVRKYEIELKPGSLMKTTLRKVNRQGQVDG